MKAAILVEQNKPLIIDEVNLPKTLEYGQVRVKVVYTSICGAQLNEIAGRKGPDKFLPHLLGHEGSGIVEETGPGVTVVKKGDHVIMHWRKGNGIHSPTPKYTWKGKPINAGWVTTFNECAVISENRLTPIAKDFDMRIAPLYGCAITTGYGVVHNDAQLKSGESIAVIGVGGAGMAVVLAASLVSANPIVAVDINDEKLKIARKFGATHLINSTKEDAKKEILKLFPKGVDVAADGTGLKSIREMAYEVTSNQGIAVLVGVPDCKEKICIDSFPLHFEKRITGSHGGDINPSYVIPRLLELQKSGRFDLSDMISHEYTLDHINEALDLIRSGKALRVMLKI